MTLYDDDHLVNRSGVTGVRLSDSTSYYVPDAAPDAPLYNTVTVEVVVWRM